MLFELTVLSPRMSHWVIPNLVTVPFGPLLALGLSQLAARHARTLSHLHSSGNRASFTVTVRRAAPSRYGEPPDGLISSADGLVDEREHVRRVLQGHAARSPARSAAKPLPRAWTAPTASPPTKPPTT